MDNPTEAWVHTTKFDLMANRSMDERVQTAEQMAPLVPRLLWWLMDANWPPFSDCTTQLARFPEATTDPILKVLGSNPDETWTLYILEFVHAHVPLGPMWMKLRPAVESIANGSAKTEDEDWEDTIEEAKAWLHKLDEWTAKQQ
jgi:hypothetical protein